MNVNISPYYAQPRIEMLAFLPAPVGRILEVGCGAGSFGVVLRRQYPEATIYGIECSPLVAEEAKKIYDHVWISDVCNALRNVRHEVFDLIIFNDILEHLVDPWLCLKLTRDQLSVNGTVVASIPNMRFWPILSDLIFQGAWTYREAGVMDRTHLRFFTKNSIRSLFEDCGYRVARLEGINKTWKQSTRWRVLNILLAGALGDCLYPQFAVVANPDISTTHSKGIAGTN